MVLAIIVLAKPLVLWFSSAQQPAGYQILRNHFTKDFDRSRKATREVAGLQNDKGVENVLNKDEEMTEKLNDFFAPAFTVEDVKQKTEIPVPEQIFPLKRESEASEVIRQIAVTRDDYLTLLTISKTTNRQIQMALTQSFGGEAQKRSRITKCKVHHVHCPFS